MKQADLAIRNANIITMDAERPRAEALVVRSGTIAGIGKWEELSSLAAGLRVLDLQGKTVLPGFIDTHAHFLWTALSLAALDVSGVTDHTSLQTVLAKALAPMQPGELLLAMGFTEYALDTDKHSPIIAALDAVAPHNPVLLIGVTGHTSAVNSCALEKLELAADVPGVMLDSEGIANGLLADEANSAAAQVFMRSFGTATNPVALLDRAVELALSVGLTTVHALEGGIAGEDKSVTEFLEMMPDLPLRFVLYYQTMDVSRVLDLGLPRIGGCILLDGDVGPHTAALSEPYADDPDCYGTLYHTQEEIDAFALAAHRAGLQVAFHAVGDAAVEQALNAYEAAIRAHPRPDHRHRIEHCEIIREDQIQRAQRLGVALAIQPPFNHYWSHTEYVRTVGEKRAEKADPVRTLMRPGLLVAGGSDSTVTPLGPLIGVHAAANHSNPAERVTVQEALELYTVNAARIAFQEADRGSLAVNKLGDLVVLAESPFDVDPGCIKDIPVDKTIIGGTIVFESS